MTGLRILHLVRSDRFAGVEHFVRRLAIAQAGAGHTVWVAGGAENGMRDALESAGVRWRRATRRGHVAQAMRALGPGADVVNTHMTDADVEGVIASIGMPRPPALVATRHFTKPRGSRPPAAFFRAIERRFDAEISISNAVAADIGVASTVVYSGVDTPALIETPPERVVLMAQRLQPEKRTDIGVRAFADSGLADGGWMLRIAGAGSERSALEALSASLGVAGATEFLGFRDDVPQLMESAAVLLAPCPVEGLGLSALEAMARALPIVAADAAGHRDLLSGLDERALFTPDVPAAAGAQLRSLADDLEGRVTLGAAERERQIADFSIDSWLAGTDAIYRAAIAARTGSGAR